MLDFLEELGIKELNSGAAYGPYIENPSGPELVSTSPIDGTAIARVKQAGADDYKTIMDKAQAVFETWRMVPAPKRGEIVRRIGLELRKHCDALGKLVTLEMGKILPEGIGEVQEMIDMADFSVGLSRQLYGPVMQSERPRHRMYEHWHPLGAVGVITAFNFPVAVQAWNAFLALVCGDVVIWKPSSKTPLTGVAVHNIVNKVLMPEGLEGIWNLLIGRGSEVGELLLRDGNVPLVSVTGSTRVGKHVAAVVGERLGNTILELGGNNAIIVAEDANLDLALRAVLFGAVGTAGQRCTSTRRLILQESIADGFIERLVKAYSQVTIGNPLEEGILMGPLVDQGAVKDMFDALEKVKEQGGEILCGGKRLTGDQYPGGCYVEPTIVRAENEMPIVQEETFAPILYVMTVKSVEEAVAMQNAVPQGLSSAIFTNNLMSAETFLSAEGSDCGIANVNLGTSGAEIGGAFGGEKETGGGREAGSDSWKAYMRRQTTTINWGKDLPLAQGIKFGD